MLPFLPFTTGVPLQGVTRRSGRVADDAAEMGSSRQKVTAPASLALSMSGGPRLTAIAVELRSPSASATSFVRRWQSSVRSSMQHKQSIYTTERAALQSQIDNAQANVNAFVRRVRGGGEDALADEQTPKWDVADKVSRRWQSLVLQSSSLDSLIESARGRHDLINNTADFATLRSDFAMALEQLVADYSSLPILLEAVADVVEAFVRRPLVTSASFLNFLLMGDPGVGKTRLAEKLAAVLGRLGILVYEQLVVCARSDFVAEYEGQTAIKTRNFLVGNLEKVIFLDEAYSLTSWQRSQGMGDDARELSGYSGEATTELVAFLSQRVGATCFIAAGYEREMLSDFLPANQGLGRRFPYRVWLKDYSAEQLVDIYLKAVAVALSDPTQTIQFTDYFTRHAVRFLVDVLESTREQSMDGARYPLIERIFSAQAGAMNTLASVTALLIASSTRRGAIGVNTAGVATWAIGVADMYDILLTMVLQRLGPYAEDAARELQTIAKANGWIAGNAWQAPDGAESLSDDVTVERVRRSRK